MSRLVARAETWEKVYQAFSNINFAAFDFNTVKQSILDYVKLYFPETFNDFIETSEFIAIVEIFAYIAELMAYRLDVNAQENFISTAQRRDSILRLAKFISYTASRPIPARGLVKLTSVSTTESIVDANGSDLANQTIVWNDITNVNWKDQFITVMNRVLQQGFGSVNPSDRFQLQSVLFELYALNLVPLPTGVFAFNTNVNGQSVPMELVPIEHDNSQGIIERRPANNADFTLLYGQDGLGDGSDTTGFFCYIKQGTLQKFRTTFDGVTPNQTYDVTVDNINDTDVWVNNVNPTTGETTDEQSILPYRSETLAGKSGEWVEVDLAHAQNVIFNTNPKRNKYELETLAQNRLRIIFGDGEFADIPDGTFDVWVRSSIDEDIVIPQASIANTQSTFTYIDTFGRTQTFTFTFSLISSLQNASASEDIEHVRTNAPAVYYSQDRMVNGEDYNSFPLQDSSILKLRAINRTFAGDSKYITWHDASGTYENVKIFGTDGILYFEDIDSSVSTPVVTDDVLISTYIEPLLNSTDIVVQITSAGVSPLSYRTVFSTTEKARISAALIPPPTPASVYLYYNIVTFEWFAIKGIQDPLTVLPNFETDFIQQPLIFVQQTSIFETTYTVTRTARRLIFQSVTTQFWNTNEAARVIEYSTLNSDYDEINILQANVNCNRAGILSQTWTYNVLGQETVESGSELGLPDTSRISILPIDEDQTGVPTGLDPSSLTFDGVADIFEPKIYVDFPGEIDLPGMVVTLPIYYISSVGSESIFDPDIEVSLEDGTPLVENVDWSRNSTGISNQITLLPNIILTAGGPGTVLIKVKEYVYFTRTTIEDPWEPAQTTPESMMSFLVDMLATTNLWKRNQGRNDLNFAWFHRSPRYYLVDPSPTNIIDSFIITKGYYLSLKRWLEDTSTTAPVAPTPLDLRNAYGYLLDNSMISDTVVLHPGKIRLLFGSKAAPALQAKFTVIRKQQSTLTDNQIKTIIVTTIRNYFDITLWEFGETFYFTELAAAIHTALPNDISSVVLVPLLLQNHFGNLFQIIAREDEIFYPDISVDDIEIVTGYTSTNLNITT